MHLIGLLGCTAPVLEPLDPPPDDTVTVSELWASPGFQGTVATIAPLIVTSPRTADGTAFFASDPLGGPQSGVRIALDRAFEDWPPPVGTRIAVTAFVVRAGAGPILEIGPDADAVDLGIVGVPPVSPFVPESGLDHGLVSVPGVTVTSAPDPLGRADLNGVGGLGGAFGDAPGWNRTGDLVGILDGGRVSPRSRDDWSGDWAGDPPLVTTLAALDDLAEGTPVVVRDLVLATPWSRDGRWAVVQDPAGVGRWVDAEGWGLWSAVSRGDVGDWTAEIRSDDAGLVLRVWDSPTSGGVRDILIGDTLTDGAIVTLEVSDIGPPDPWGERPTDGPTLDDRFLDLGELPDPVTLTGAVRTSSGPDRLAPFP